MHLYPFQEKAIAEMLSFLKGNESNGVYNACSQGLGKSAMSIICSNKLYAKSILILCPKSVILNWQAEFKLWAAYSHEYLLVLAPAHLKKIPLLNYSVVIMSYDTAKKPRAIKAITTRSWDLLIIDEAHSLKNRTSQRSRAILTAIWPKTKYRICLSATPITNTVADAYTLFNALCPSVFKNYYEFLDSFSNIDKTPWGDKPYGIKNADVLKTIIRKKFFIRYTKEEVGIELPEKIFTKIILPPEYVYKVPRTDEEALAEQVDVLVKSIEQNKPLPAVPKTIAGFRKAQALKSASAVIEFVKNLCEQDIPVVVFTYHTEVLRLLRSELGSFGPVFIYGETSAKDREQAVQDFQGGKTNLFIGQIVAGGTGINLQRSSNVVFAELDWSPANIEQALSRCHRIGSKYPVNIYYFVVEKSIEERIINTVMDKTKVFNKMMEK